MKLPICRLCAAGALFLVSSPLARADVPEAPPPETLVSTDRLMETLRALPVRRASWSDDTHKQGLRDTERLVVDRLRAMGYAPELDPVDAIGSRAGIGDGAAAGADATRPWNNIIVSIPGATSAREVLILGAHIDAVADCPGADDNGTGVAALLEAARVLFGRPVQRTVRLIFFNLEEVGLTGSRAYVERLKTSLHSGEQIIVGMASLDGIGYYTDAPGSQQNPLPPLPGFEPPTVGNFLAIGGILRHRTFSQALAGQMRAAEPKLPLVVVDVLPIAPRDLLRSDHAPFLAADLPGVIVTDTANFRSRHYHQPTDTADTIDPERFTLATRAVVGAIYRLAGPPGKPLIELRAKTTDRAPKSAPPSPAP